MNCTIYNIIHPIHLEYIVEEKNSVITQLNESKTKLNETEKRISKPSLIFILKIIRNYIRNMLSHFYKKFLS